MPALSTYLIEPIWEQFSELLPARKTDHLLGCHRSRVPDKVIFEKLVQVLVFVVQVLVFGCAYWRIADDSCSATTLRRRRDEWIDSGVMDTLREIVLGAYDRLIGLRLSDVAVDGCITKAPCGGEMAGRSPVDRGKQGIKRSTVVDASGLPLGAIAAPANRHDSPLLEETLHTLEPKVLYLLAPLRWAQLAPSTREFYDGLAGEYHHLFGSWDETVRRQGGVLGGLSRRRTGRRRLPGLLVVYIPRSSYSIRPYAWKRGVLFSNS